MIKEYIQPLVHYLTLHPAVGILTAFLIALTESLPILGTIIPGSITMTAVGTLVGTHVLPAAPVYFWASLGAFIGDYIGFWLGSRYHEHIREWWPFNKFPQWLQKGEYFFAQHGGKSIIFGRFIGPARSTVPLVAGLLRMSTPRFIAAAIPSAILWAALYLTPGVLLGTLALEMPASQITQFLLSVFFVLLLIWAAGWLLRRLVHWLAQQWDRGMQKLWIALDKRPWGHAYLNWIRCSLQPNDPRQLSLVIAAGCGLFLFIIFFIGIVQHNVLTAWNAPLNHFFTDLRHANIDPWALMLTFLAEKSVVFMLTAIICVGLWLQKDRRTMTHWLGLIAAATLCAVLLKGLVPSARPQNIASIDPTYSFPSGHTLYSVCVYGFLGYLISVRLMRYRAVPLIVAASIVLLVALSRLYLGAHWLTDILGSFFLGTALLFTSIMLYRRRALSERLSLPAFYGILGFALLFPWLSYSALEIKHELPKYQIQWNLQRLSFNTWWQQPLQHLPLYRSNHFGTPTQAFNIQWASSKDTLTALLKQQGWEAVDPRQHWKRFILHITHPLPENQASLLPPLYRGHHPALMWIKHLPGTSNLVELQLWTAGVQYTDSPLPLWIGTLQLRTTQKHPPSTWMPFIDPRAYLNLDPTAWKVQAVPVQTPEKAPHSKALRNWQGPVVVLQPA